MSCHLDTKAYDTVWVDVWHGDKVQSRVCVRQFTAEQSRDDVFAGTLATVLPEILDQSCSSENPGKS